MTEPEPRLGETFGFALFCQGSVSFARFFCPFLPENACFFARFCPVSPVLPGSFGFVQIHQDSFGFVRPLFAWFRPSLIEIRAFSFQICFEINFRLWEVVKRKIHKYAYLGIFCLTTSQSRKLIPKADLKKECPYFYSKFSFEEFWSIFKKSTNGFLIIFSKSDLTGVSLFLTKFFSEKAKHPKICLSLGGSMPEAQI